MILMVILSKIIEIIKFKKFLTYIHVMKKYQKNLSKKLLLKMVNKVFNRLILLL